MPHVFNRFYEKATSWLYEYDPGSLPARQPAKGPTASLGRTPSGAVPPGPDRLPLL